MQIAAPKETHSGEKRVSLVPETVAKWVKLGASVAIETGLGTPLYINDGDYTQAGATVHQERKALLAEADLVVRLRKPPIEEIKWQKKGSIHISFLDPFNEKLLIDEFVRAGVSAISMEMIPRSTRAQKMDALSSQASLAGYTAVLLAAERSPKTFPMMTTPAGTIPPARIFVIGAGVAGLQAIATAHRLGARVEAFDTRPVVEEQVKSLGAKFIKIDIGEVGQTVQGYAKELAPEQIKKQREGMKAVCAVSDVVITTAQVFGKKTPLIVTKEMVAAMKPGSVVVDLAVESGGNVEGAQLDHEVEISGVKVIGLANMPGRVALDASRMYSNNLFNMIQEFWNKDTKSFQLKLEDEIIKGCLLTHEGCVLKGS